MEKFDKWFSFIFLCLMKNEITKRGEKAGEDESVGWNIEVEVESIIELLCFLVLGIVRLRTHKKCHHLAFLFRLHWLLVFSRQAKPKLIKESIWCEFTSILSFLMFCFYNGFVTHVETMGLSHQAVLSWCRKATARTIERTPKGLWMWKSTIGWSLRKCK